MENETTTIPPNGITLTSEQAEAVACIEEWKGGIEPTPNGFCSNIDINLGGYAGTGKTTILRGVVEGENCLVLAPTGKAAQVLREKGVEGADTIHSFRYNYRGKRLNERKGRHEPVFDAKHSREIVCPDFLVVDEASMVNQRIYDDLSALKIPTLWVGDHGQLPPVGKDPGLMKDLHIRLETIHRTALESPILRIAHRVREGMNPRHFDNGGDGLTLLRKSSLDRIVYYAIRENVDQVLCGFHRTRNPLNRKFREMAGRAGAILSHGDRVICTMNNRRLNWFNGMTGTVHGNPDISHAEGVVYADIKDLATGKLRRCVPVFLPYLKAIWDGKEPDPNAEPGPTMVQFDYGYAITTHKSQGSEFGHVLVVDEQCRVWDAARWRYTAFTRAKERLTVVV